jgi:hypothetical protein
MTNTDDARTDDPRTRQGARSAARAEYDPRVPPTDHYDGTPLTHDVGERVDDTLTAVEEHDDEGDLDLWLRVISDAQGAMAQLQVLIDECERRALEVIPLGRNAVSDVAGVFTASKPARRTSWDDNLIHKYTRAAVQAGIINNPDDFAAALKAAAGISYWRVGPLKDVGIDPNDVREQDFYDARLKRIS